MFRFTMCTLFSYCMFCLHIYIYIIFIWPLQFSVQTVTQTTLFIIIIILLFIILSLRVLYPFSFNFQYLFQWISWELIKWRGCFEWNSFDSICPLINIIWCTYTGTCVFIFIYIAISWYVSYRDQGIVICIVLWGSCQYLPGNCWNWIIC